MKDQDSLLTMTNDRPPPAAAQEGPLAIVRLWERRSGACLALLQQHACDMHALALSHDGTRLAAVGKDHRARQMLALWDISAADAPVPAVELVDAKVTLHHVRRLAFVPPAGGSAEEPQLASCGFESVRFWRVKRGKLHCCGLPLQHHEGEMLLDLAFDPPPASPDEEAAAPDRPPVRMLVSSSGGKLFQVDPLARRLEYVFALHDGPIDALALGRGFAVTGGADGKLCAWRLDFGACWLERELEGPVVALSPSPDGLKLLAGTRRGAVGLLDFASGQLAPLLRAHTDFICAVASDPHNRELATASCDGTVRVWELDGAAPQLVEFEVPGGCARSVAYHPADYSLACGFDDGTVRVFDIGSTSLLAEHRQHRGRVLALAHAHGARRLFSAASDGSLVAYDSAHQPPPCPLARVSRHSQLTATRGALCRRTSTSLAARTPPRRAQTRPASPSPRTTLSSSLGACRPTCSREVAER